MSHCPVVNGLPEDFPRGVGPEGDVDPALLVLEVELAPITLLVHLA